MAKPLTSSYLVSQGYSIVNDAYKEIIGDKASGTLDSTSFVDMGRTLGDLDMFDGFYGCITNKIVKTVAYVLQYKADGRKILHDSITYGAFIEKVYVDSMDAVETPSYKITQSSGTMSNISDPYGVTATYTITSKIFGKSTTWSLEFNTDTHLIKKAFLNESEMIAFVDSIFAKAKTDIEIEKEALCNTAINTGIFSAVRGGCVYNLLPRYNTKFSKSLTKANAIYDSDFLKWSNAEINRIVRLMAKPTKKYNPSHYLNASDRNALTLEVLDQYANNSKVFLESGTYHADKVAISGNYVEVPFWQFDSDDFLKASCVSLKNSDIWNNSGTAVEYTQNGIIAIARANDSVSSLFELDYQWSMPNPRARINSYGYDFNRGYCVEPHANFVVFIIDDIGSDTATLCSLSTSGDIAVGNTVTVTVTPNSGKSVSTAKYCVGSTKTNLTATSTTNVYTFVVPVGYTGLEVVCA